MKAVVWKARSVPVCILGSDTLQGPPSRETATPGNGLGSVVWESPQGLRGEAGAVGAEAGGTGSGLG